MLSAIHQGFKQYVLDTYSEADYEEIVSKAGFAKDHFEADEYFKDDDLNLLLATAQEKFSKTRHDILYEYGLHGAPGLFEMFKDFIDVDWKTFDFIEAVEGRMHKYMREEAGAFPPALKTERLSDDELKVSFISHRDMWGLAKGFITGFAAQYGETVTIDVEHHGRQHTCTIQTAATP